MQHDGMEIWVGATPVGYLTGVPGSWLQLQLGDHGGRVGREPADGCLLTHLFSLSLCLSYK